MLVQLGNNRFHVEDVCRLDLERRHGSLCLIVYFYNNNPEVCINTTSDVPEKYMTEYIKTLRNEIQNMSDLFYATHGKLTTTNGEEISKELQRIFGLQQSKEMELTSEKEKILKLRYDELSTLVNGVKSEIPII